MNKLSSMMRFFLIVFCCLQALFVTLLAFSTTKSTTSTTISRSKSLFLHDSHSKKSRVSSYNIRTSFQNVLFSSQWDEEEEKEVIQQVRSSFTEADDGLKQLEDTERFGNKDENFDVNRQYKSETVDQVRDVIKARADALGIEKATAANLEYIKEYEARAKAEIANRASGGTNQLLDLTKITNEKPRDKMDSNLPSIFYEPEDDMTEEEKVEADPLGQEPFQTQFFDLIKRADFPTFGAATRQVIILLLSVVVSGGLIVGYDSFLKNLYTNLGLIPTEEQQAEYSRQRGRVPSNEVGDKALQDSLKSFEDQATSTSTSDMTLKGQ